MRWFFLILVSLLLTCSKPNTECTPGWKFTEGIFTCSGPAVTAQELFIIIQTIEEQLQVHYPQVIDIKKEFHRQQLAIKFIPRPMATDCKELESRIFMCGSWINGVTLDEGHFIYTNHTKCLANSALAHELLHSIEYFYLDGPVGDHQTPYMFRIDAERQGIKITDTIEDKILTILYSKLPNCE